MTMRFGLVMLLLVVGAFISAPVAQTPARPLPDAVPPDAVTADAKHYTVAFENDIVRLLRVRLGAGESAPPHAHVAYCAIEITDSSLREGDGPASSSKAGEVFCGDATSHGPTNVGKGMAESIVVEFKNRQRVR